MSGCRFLAARIATLAVCSLICTFANAADVWRAYTSENFTLYTDGSEAETKRTLERFEIFRDSALAVLGLERQAENQRLLIVVYDKKRDFDRISPRLADGFFYDAISGPRMIMHGVARESEVRSVLYHEYVHYLMRQRSPMNYPLWYMEGLATVLMTTKISDETIQIGDAPPNYATAIRYGLNPRVRDVLVPERGIGGDFYLTAWLLSHYLLFNDGERRAQTADYLRRYDAGEEPLAAFEASYGISPSDMGVEIGKYASRHKIGGLAAKRPERQLAISARTLAPDEALLLLASIAAENSRYDAAHLYFDEADKLGGEAQYRTNLMSRRAIAYIHEKKTSDGDELMSRVMAAGSDDGQVLGDIAHYAYDRFVEIRAGRSQGSEAEQLARAIEYGQRAVAADPFNLEAHYYLGLAYEAEGKLQQAVDALLAGYDIHPVSPRLNMDLARVLIKGRQHDYASYLASRLYSVSHSERWRTGLQSLIEDLADKDVDITQHSLLLPSWERSGDE